ncbi:MAG: dienelactone hydrolase family protein [Microbacteriaceae bacterium]|nr:dienelactone hydrolase family protein [Microbacteriaceae bacterium]
MAERDEVQVDDVHIDSAIPGTSEHLAGVLAGPVGPGPWPGVVMVHEAFGINDILRRQAARLAFAGFLVLAPNLFSEGGARKCLGSTFRSLLTGEGRAFADIESARSALLKRTDCTGRVGVIGFCMGGGFALLLSTHGYDAISVNYGRLPGDLDALAGACPVIGSYGGKDLSLRGAAAKLDSALSRLGVTHDVKEYPDAGHSFLNDEQTGSPVLRPVLHRVLGAGPDPEASADAWERIEEFFSEHLRSAGQR